jgi:hypothetical protein
VDHIYVMKIDTQAHEAFVLDGLKNTIANRKPLYVIVEVSGAPAILLTGPMSLSPYLFVCAPLCAQFWPRAMAELSPKAGGSGLYILRLLAGAGYTLFDGGFGMLNARFATGSDEAQNVFRFGRSVTLETVEQWYLDMDKKWSDTFGTWSDIIAVKRCTNEELAVYGGPGVRPAAPF